jgi:hypothetical protein
MRTGASREAGVRAQTLFREVNIQIRELVERWDRDDGRFDAVCECADISCSRSISVDCAVFDRVVGRQDCFFLDVAHRLAADERLVSEDGRCLVVERLGVAA